MIMKNKQVKRMVEDVIIQDSKTVIELQKKAKG